MRRTGKAKRDTIIKKNCSSPSYEELIGHCLYNKIHKKPIVACNRAVKECDLYSEEPWEIWNKNGGPESEAKHKKGVLYLFTKLKRKTANSKRFERRVVQSNGGGWEGEESPKKITTKNCVGFKKRFRYENPNNSEHDKRWIMVEFNLERPNDFVLCSLEKNGSRRIGRRRRRKKPLNCDQKEEETSPTTDPPSTPATPPRNNDTEILSDQEFLLDNHPLTMPSTAAPADADNYGDHVVYSDTMLEFAKELLLLQDQFSISVQEGEIEMLPNENCNNSLGWERIYY